MRFKLRLALCLSKTLRDIDNMPLTEFRLWQAYYQVEPFGPDIDDERWSTHMAMYANAHGQKTKVGDFSMVKLPVARSEQDVKKAIMKWANTLNQFNRK